MKKKVYPYLLAYCLFTAIFYSNCTTTRLYNFSLKNTLAIFLLKNEKTYFFCLPIQYVGEYQIQSFEFRNGNILIGEYNILLNRDEIKIYVYLNEEANEEKWNSETAFNLVYSEENGRISVSKMQEPLAKKNDPDYLINHYYIFIEKHLNKNDEKMLIKEFEKCNVNSQFNIWYDLIIDNEEQNGSGLLDNFVLHNGYVLDTLWFPSNLDFFKSKYL